MRIFVAYAISDDVKIQLHHLQQQLSPIYQNGRFKQPKNMHMTLRFVGEVNETQLASLIDEIDNIIDKHPVQQVILDQLGFFGKSAKKHSLWIGCHSQPPMEQLSNEITQCVIRCNIAVNDTPFVPHITLAQHGVFIGELPLFQPLKADLNRVCIYSSSRIEGELVYQPVKCWKLN